MSTENRFATMDELLNYYEIVNPKEQEFICGFIHSGIPFCCVMFYLGNWIEFTCEVNGIRPCMIKIDGQETFGLYVNSRSVYQVDESSYIMCPDCIIKFIEGKGKPITVKRCQCE